MADGYRSPSVVATEKWFGPFGAHHQCKDLGSVHDTASGYYSPSVVATETGAYCQHKDLGRAHDVANRHVVLPHWCLPLAHGEAMWAKRGGIGPEGGHKDSGRTHDMAQWLLQLVCGGCRDVVWSH